MAAVKRPGEPGPTPRFKRVPARVIPANGAVDLLNDAHRAAGRNVFVIPAKAGIQERDRANR